MTSKFFAVALLCSTVLVTPAARAADVGYSGLPAVSAVNGKVEFQGGSIDLNSAGKDVFLYGGAALSIPLGDAYGFQGDITVANAFNDTAVGGTAHLFTRDPNSHLLGVIGGYASSDYGNILWGGGEAEFYMGNFTAQTVLGGSHSESVAFAGSQSDFLGILDLSYYATENFRLTGGASSVAGFESGGLGFEWQLAGMPLALKADGRVGEDGYKSIKAGLTFYFGGNDSSKSLIRRHREDDPPIRGFVGSGTDIFGAGVLGGASCDQNPETPLPWCED